MQNKLALPIAVLLALALGWFLLGSEREPPARAPEDRPAVQPSATGPGREAGPLSTALEIQETGTSARASAEGPPDEPGPFGEIAGRVLDAETRRPVAGARIHLRWDGAAIPQVEDAVADAAGAFRLERVPLSKLQGVCASAAGYPEGSAGCMVRSPDEPAEVEILLTARPTLTVQIVEYPTGLPIADAEVNGACADAAGLATVEKVLTDFDGSIELSVRAEGFCDLGGRVQPADLPARSPLLVQLPLTARFAGIVRDEQGRPVSGATLRFHLELETIEGEDPLDALLPPQAEGLEYWVDDWGQAKTDGEGHYLSTSLFPGARRFEVRAEHPEAGDVITNAGPLGGPGTTTRLDLTLERRPTGTIEGLVHFNGNWFPCDVLWQNGPRRGRAKVLIGDYRIEKVEPGAVELQVHSNESWFRQMEGFLPGVRTTVFVEPGRTTRHDFDLALPLDQVGGRVTSADGRPVGKVLVGVVHEDPQYRNYTWTDAEGNWRDKIPDLQWEYQVQVQHGEELVRVPSVRAGDRNVNLVLPVLAALPVRVVDDETGQALGSPAISWRRRGEETFRASRAEDYVSADVHPALQRSPDVGPDGSILLLFQPGELDLLVEAGGRRVQIDGVIVGSGQNAPLEIRMKRDGG